MHQQIAARFPDEAEPLNQLAVTYMTVNRIKEATNVLEKVLKRWPKNGFAMVNI